MIIRPTKWIVLKATLLCLNFQQLIWSILTSIHLMVCFVFPKILLARSLILSFSAFEVSPCCTFLTRELKNTWSHSTKSYRKGNFKNFAGLSMKVFVIAFQDTSYIYYMLSTYNIHGKMNSLNSEYICTVDWRKPRQPNFSWHFLG